VAGAVAERHKRGDDSPGARASNVIKVIGKDQLGIAESLAQLSLEPREDFDGDNAAEGVVPGQVDVALATSS
jgi:hypothetical protein